MRPIDIKKEVEKFAKDSGITIFEGDMRDKPNIVFFAKDDLKEFLEIAKGSNTKIIILETIVFGPEIENYDEQYSKYKGDICAITIYWVKDGMLYAYRKTAEWFDSIMEGEGEKKEEDDLESEEDQTKCEQCGELFYSYGNLEKYCEKCMDKKRREGEKKAENLAQELVKEPDFVACKNKTERKIYLKEKYPELFEDEFFPIYHLLNHARALTNLKKRREK